MARARSNPKWRADGYEIRTHERGGKWGWTIHDVGDDEQVLAAPADEYDWRTEGQAVKVALWHVNRIKGSWIPFPLTEEESDTLATLGRSYDSPKKLFMGHDVERDAIQYEDAFDALQATEGDGGDFGTVPGVGGKLEEKIWELWHEVEKRD